MTWATAILPALAGGLAVLALALRRAELRAWRRSREERRDARARGSDRARLQHPHIDTTQCIGCGACVRACPEAGVLALLHGQAVVVHGARCVGHGLCASACPTGAIALTLGDVGDRRDLPALDQELEAVGVPGLFVAGELGGFALVRNAVTQGVAVADAVSRRVAVRATLAGRDPRALAGEPLALLVVGAGPGGLACALRAKELGLHALTIEQAEQIGGTVAAYPRRKLVMTQPMVLPLHGRLPRLQYGKEQLIELWEDLVRKHELAIRTGVRLLGIERDGDGVFVARTSAGDLRARHVCLALGRRGTPRKLGVPGEDLAKVAHGLLDAESWRGRRILVVGGGDSAVEAALALAEQPGNAVTLSYRRPRLFRLKARNDARIHEALHAGRIRGLLDSEVLAIEPDRVWLRVAEHGRERRVALPNDDVFVLAGGTPPFALLEQASVSFDPAQRPPPPPARRPGSGLLAALALVLLAAFGALGLALWHRGYYGLERGLRPASPLHASLRPGAGLGLGLGLLACGLFACNLAYLLRRSFRLGGLLPGTLRQWMTAHVLTGLLGFPCVLVHAGFVFGHSVGGHALAALTVVVVTGAIGRWLYAFVPRAANGVELQLDELRARLDALTSEWQRDGSGFRDEVRAHVERHAEVAWQPGLARRLRALAAGSWQLRSALRPLRRQGLRAGLPPHEVQRVLALARQMQRLLLLLTHHEEVRGALAAWRWLHRWLALLLVLLVAIHVATALRFAGVAWGSLVPGGWR